MGDGGGKTIRNDGTISVGAGGTGISASVNTVIINNGTIAAGANGTSISSLGGAPGNTITNNGTLNGQILIQNTSSTLTNNGLIEITNAGTTVGTTHEISSAGGTFIQSASGTLALRVNNAGAADKMIADTITLNGGTLRAVVQAGLYSAPLTYSNVLFACSCGLTGTFATVASSSPFFTASAAYDYAAGSADLTLTRIPFGSVPGMTENQRAIGNALEAHCPGRSALEVVVDQADGLHQGVHRRRPDEGEARLLERLGQRDRLGARWWARRRWCAAPAPARAGRTR